MPTGLTATAASDRQIDLSWTAPSWTGSSAISGYKIEVSGNGSTWRNLVADTDSTATTYSHSGRQPNQTVYYRVSAINSHGTGLASDVASATTLADTFPPTLTGSSVNNAGNQLILSFNENVDLTAANIPPLSAFVVTADGEAVPLQSISPSGARLYTLAFSSRTVKMGQTVQVTYTDPTAGDDTEALQDLAGNDVATFTANPMNNSTVAPVAPDAPSGLMASAVGQSRIDLSWTAPAYSGGSAVTGYRIEVSDDAGATWADRVADTASTDTAYSHTGLSAEDTRHYRVSAINSAGTGTASNVANATTSMADTAPGIPTGLSATAVGRTRIDLSWNAPSSDGGQAVTGYKIEVSSDGGTAFTDLVANTGNTNTTYSHTGLSAGTTRHYRVSAINSVGTGNASAVDSATTGAAAAPGPPRGLRARASGQTAIGLSWNAPSDDGGSAVTGYRIEVSGDGSSWSTLVADTGNTGRTYSHTGLSAGDTRHYRVSAINSAGAGNPSNVARATAGSRDEDDLEEELATVPDAPGNLQAAGGDGAVTLSWEAPGSDGGAAITDYQVQVGKEGEWISTGSTDTTHSITGLTSGTVYLFRVRAVNRIGAGPASGWFEATAGAVITFTHFANGIGITSEVVLVNLFPRPAQPALYFYDTGGDLIDPASVMAMTGDLAVAEDGSLTVNTAMEPQGELTISTHGQGELVSGSLRVAAGVPIGGLVRYSVPGVGVTGVGAGLPVRDILFPARRREGGIRTAAALHNLEERELEVSCRLMSGGANLEEVEILLEANGQASWFIEEAFTRTDTSDFQGSVRCTVPGNARFTAIAVETDADQRIYTPLAVVGVDRTGGSEGETVLDFAHFANGTWVTDLVLVNLSPLRSGPTLSPFQSPILPSRPAIYFHDTEGNPVDPTSLVDLTGDLEVAEDGALTVGSAMEPLAVLTISTHGRGELVTGSVRVVSEGPIGGMLRFAHPDFGVGGVGAGSPASDVVFPVRRQEGGINTGVAIRNLESTEGTVSCELQRQGVPQDSVSFSLAANGQTSWTIDQGFPETDTSDFTGSVRCSTEGGNLFTAVALELDSGTRAFTTLPLLPLPEMPSQEQATPARQDAGHSPAGQAMEGRDCRWLLKANQEQTPGPMDLLGCDDVME